MCGGGDGDKTERGETRIMGGDRIATAGVKRGGGNGYKGRTTRVSAGVIEK